MESTPPLSANMKKHILIACQDIALVGGLLRFERVGKVLREWGHEIAFLTLSGAPAPQRESEFRVLDFEQAAAESWDAVMAPGAAFPPETIEKFHLFSDDRFGIRVQHLLNDQSRRKKFLELNRAFSPHLVIFNNTAWPVGSFTDFQAERFHILQGAVDSELFSPLPSREHWLDSNRWIIGGLANKNPFPLIEALAELPQNVTLRLYGSDRHGLAKKHETLLGEGRLELVGALEGGPLSEFYHSVDCVVMTEETAGWANLAAEALASGLPLVCTEHGTDAFARHEATALVMQAATATQIRTNIERLMGDADLCRRLGAEGREAIRKYSWDDYTSKLLGLIYRDGNIHYSNSPERGLYGKWSPKERGAGLEPLMARAAGMSVLDLGCAEGFIADLFLRHDAQSAHGFDRNPFSVSVANREFGAQGCAEFHCADLSDWKEFIRTNAEHLADDYDIVLYLGLHHHLPKRRRLDTLRGALSHAHKFFVIRTPQKVFEADGIDSVIASAGFRPLSQLRDESRDYIGTLKIYEKAVARPQTKPTRPQFVSFPKSGRSWIRYILVQLDVERHIRFHHDGFEYNDGSKPPLDFDFDSRLGKYSAIDKIVYLKRDPRDVMVSLYFQVTGRFRDFFDYQQSISDFLRDEYFGAHNLRKFLEMWDEICRRRGYLAVTYEQCHRDMESVIRKILAYYEFDAPSDQIREAVEASEFQNMRKLEESGSFDKPWLRPRNGSQKVRRGKVGGFQDTLAREDIDFLNDTFSTFTDHESEL